MISASLSGFRVRRCEQRIHLWLFQVRDQCMRSLFEWHRPNLAAPIDQLGSMQADEPGQSVDSRQALVPGSDSTSPLLLQVTQELPHAVRRDIRYLQAIDLLACAPGDMGKQELQSIAVAALGI